MGLEVFWFWLIAVLWSGYFLLEGFDFGVGILLPFLGRDEADRKTMLKTIGPVWDGNEVWLVVAAGATFAAFPAWYATMFSGFYLALLAILVLLIVRVVSFEWLEKSEDPRWRTTWRWANTAGSVGVPLLWGIALFSLVHGVPLSSSGGYSGDILDLFTLYTVFAGIVLVLVCALHGATFLCASHWRRAAASARPSRRLGLHRPWPSWAPGSWHGRSWSRTTGTRAACCRRRYPRPSRRGRWCSRWCS